MALDGLREVCLLMPGLRYVMSRLRFDQFKREVGEKDRICLAAITPLREMTFRDIRVEWSADIPDDLVRVVICECPMTVVDWSPTRWRASEVTATIGTENAMRAAYEACVNPKPVETRSWEPAALVIERQNVIAAKLSALKRELWRYGKSEAVKLREWPVCKQTGKPKTLSVSLYDDATLVYASIDCACDDCRTVDDVEISRKAPEYLTRAWKALGITEAIRATEVDA